MSSFGPVVALANLGSTLQNTLAAGGRVLDLLDEAPLVEEVEGKSPVSFSGGSCEQVTFSYGEETILSDLSLDVRKGEILGIIGPSGSEIHPAAAARAVLGCEPGLREAVQYRREGHQHR